MAKILDLQKLDSADGVERLDDDAISLSSCDSHSC